MRRSKRNADKPIAEETKKESVPEPKRKRRVEKKVATEIGNEAVVTKSSNVKKPKSEVQMKQKVTKKIAKELDEDSDATSTTTNGKADKIPEPQSVANEISVNTKTHVQDVKQDSSSKDEQANFKITSWNIGGIRAWMKKDGLKYFQAETPDVICLQEIRGNKSKPIDIPELTECYKIYWCESVKPGYAGVALLSKTEPLSVTYGIGDEEHDIDGRCITAEYDKFYVLSVYVTNAGRGLVTLGKRLKWNEVFQKYVIQLDAKKPVIICGDMNVAHTEIDLSNPKTNVKNAGFTPEERQGMSDFLAQGFVDTFRKLYPDKREVYTFWSFMKNSRARNIGWRLDYFIVSERLMGSVCNSIAQNEYFGSDHCPIKLLLDV